MESEEIMYRFFCKSPYPFALFGSYSKHRKVSTLKRIGPELHPIRRSERSVPSSFSFPVQSLVCATETVPHFIFSCWVVLT